MVVPPSEPVSPGRVSINNGHYSEETAALDRSSLEEILLLTSLKDLVGTGEHRLDTILSTIADAARRLTGASGSAIAMWKDGAMVCRARSGDTAPALGAQLNSETGISGECLRTSKVQHCADTENNPLVDVDVCRALGLRSIAVLPIQGWRGINGILEVFATAPGVFTDHHLEVLEQLAALAERARASQPHGASPVVTKQPAEAPQPSGILPASDPVGDVALAFFGRRTRPIIAAAIGLAAVLLIGFVIWLGWRGPAESDGKAHAAAPASATVTARPIQTHLPDNDPVWKPNPGGEVLVPTGGKPSAGSPVTFAAKVDVIESKKASTGRSLLSGDAVSVALPRRSSEPVSEIEAKSPDSKPVETAASIEPPSLSAEQANPAALSGVLTAKAALPGFTAPVSQGLAGGEPLHRVAPIYPRQAREQRLEGKVVLGATVMEDGSVRNLKVVQGPPLLAQAAVEAVKSWRYRPYKLDGKPVKMETTITMDFKLPSGAPAR